MDRVYTDGTTMSDQDLRNLDIVRRMYTGDAAYTQDLLIAQAIDRVGPDPLAQQATHQALLQLAQDQPTVFLPSHEWDAERRLLAREPLFVAARNDVQHATQSGGMAGA
jgi:hypothetical protein